MAKLPLNDEIGNTGHRISDIGEETCLFILVHKIEQSTKLNIVIIAFTVVIPDGRLQYRQMYSSAHHDDSDEPGI